MIRQVQGLCVWLCLVGIAAAERPQIRLRPVAPPEGEEAAAEADVEQVAALLMEMTNSFRQKENRRPLVANAALAKAAGDFATFMATSDKYGHTADGRKPADRIEAAGYDYCLVDENIAWLFQTRGFSTQQLARQLFESWQHSPEHRDNLLNPHLGEIGVAVARSPNTGRYFGVQEFGRPKSEQVAFEIRNSTGEQLAYRIDGQTFTLEPRCGRQHKRSIPPDLEIAVYRDQPDASVTFRPATGDRFIARRDATDRIVITNSRPAVKSAVDRANTPAPAD